MDPRPLVLVTATTRTVDGVERVRLNQAYVSALEGAGVVPLVLPPLKDLSLAESVLRAAHGLVFTGGEDVDPAHYGAAPHPATFPSHAARDRWELELAMAARRASLPTLAICRGVQVMNVALGGTLIQDIGAERGGALAHESNGVRDERVHDVRVEPGSLLASLLGTGALRVNSSHHQAVDRVADGLRITAESPDGIAEGAEWAGPEWWMVGVQWHPEELVRTTEPWDRALFAGFAERCRAATAVSA